MTKLKEKFVKGYKVFNPDWTCKDKQYSCPGKFEEEGELEICQHGMHFCRKLADAFIFYEFNPSNHVAEVIAYGDVVSAWTQSQFCTDKLEIVREIPWEEVLQIVNLGKNCTGSRNTGDWNTGNWNTGSRNTGNYNTGNYNTGDCNTGNYNTGDCNTGSYNGGRWNTGDYNTGDCNTGSYNGGRWNTGDYNTGDYNTGNYNTGDCNTGSYNGGRCNTGSYNTGYWNTGNWNTGNGNTGDWNTGNKNTGCFMTEEQKIMLFNKPSDWSYGDWLKSDARYLLNQVPNNVVEWVRSDDMTDEEKLENPAFETTGGYLKTLDESECRQTWWNSLTEEEKNIITNIPNFDAEIFKECTGIDVNEN